MAIHSNGMENKTKRYMEGDKATCPNCGGMEFCIGEDDIWTVDEYYADCTNCLTSTLVSLLRAKYPKDKSKHFKRFEDVGISITLFCSKCQKTHRLNGQYTERNFWGTMYTEITPEPKKWKCPEHCDATVQMLIDGNCEALDRLST